MRRVRRSPVVALSALAVILLGNAVAAPLAEPRATAADGGVLQTFAPESASSWWAVVASNLEPKTYVVRTSDSGKHWSAVTPPVKLIASSFFLSSRAAWIAEGALHSVPTAVLFRTLDGGRSWRRLASVPSECRLDFVDERHGWCIAIGAATGSETVRLYRTVDGGSNWTLVSRTGLYDNGSTPAALPFGCDKTLAFTSPRVGWAATYCAGGTPFLYTSRDGGARWQRLARVPQPSGLRTLPAGAGVSLPAVFGSQLAVSLEIGGSPRGATAIATSANGGRTWRTRLVPGPLRYRRVDLLDVRPGRSPTAARCSEPTTPAVTGGGGDLRCE